MKTILIVDDEQEIRNLIKEGLSRHGYQVFTAGNADEALAAAQTKKPDLILLDIAMPGLDGYETCQKLKKETELRDVPVIFLTGKDLDPKGIIERYDRLGARGYIPKPSSLQDLLVKIRETLSK